ncbi:MAG: pyridoxal phosphate-dependent aminotransferase family protein, partial [Campylobacterota bacterium]|nr:pyridoxal phosphate-dependent aminotransferase family protein [Campylobacterota bacterium]
MYTKELNALKKSGRYRERKIFDENLIDLASNDYLGLSSNESVFDAAYQAVK